MLFNERKVIVVLDGFVCFIFRIGNFYCEAPSLHELSIDYCCWDQSLSGWSICFLVLLSKHHCFRYWTHTEFKLSLISLWLGTLNSEAHFLTWSFAKCRLTMFSSQITGFPLECIRFNLSQTSSPQLLRKIFMPNWASSIKKRLKLPSLVRPKKTTTTKRARWSKQAVIGILGISDSLHLLALVGGKKSYWTWRRRSESCYFSLMVENSSNDKMSGDDKGKNLWAHEGDCLFVGVASGGLLKRGWNERSSLINALSRQKKHSHPLRNEDAPSASKQRETWRVSNLITSDDQDDHARKSCRDFPSPRVGYKSIRQTSPTMDFLRQNLSSFINECWRVSSDKYDFLGWSQSSFFRCLEGACTSAFDVWMRYEIIVVSVTNLSRWGSHWSSPFVCPGRGDLWIKKGQETLKNTSHARRTSNHNVWVSWNVSLLMTRPMLTFSLVISVLGQTICHWLIPQWLFI